MSEFDVSKGEGHTSHHTIPLLHIFSAPQIARLIRALDSRLMNIEYEEQQALRILIYTFEVAGKLQSFHIVLSTNVLDSIADLYPDAAVYEQQLQEHTPLTFRQDTSCSARAAKQSESP